MAAACPLDTETEHRQACTHAAEVPPPRPCLAADAGLLECGTHGEVGGHRERARDGKSTRDRGGGDLRTHVGVFLAGDQGGGGGQPLGPCLIHLPGATGQAVLGAAQGSLALPAPGPEAVPLLYQAQGPALPVRHGPPPPGSTLTRAGLELLLGAGSCCGGPASGDAGGTGE